MIHTSHGKVTKLPPAFMLPLRRRKRWKGGWEEGTGGDRPLRWKKQERQTGILETAFFLKQQGSFCWEWFSRRCCPSAECSIRILFLISPMSLREIYIINQVWGQARGTSGGIMSGGWKQRPPQEARWCSLCSPFPGLIRDGPSWTRAFFRYRYFLCSKHESIVKFLIVSSSFFPSSLSSFNVLLKSLSYCA